MCISAGEHPKASGVNLGEAAASHNERAAHAHGTHDAQAQSHAAADKRSIGHKPRSADAQRGAFYRGK